MVKTVSAAIVAALVFYGCAKPSPAEMLEKGTVLYRAGEFAPALDEFTKLVATHPNSIEAETASFQIAAIHNNHFRDYQKAIVAYRNYLDRYPEGAHAAMATFLIGYIYHNELHNLDSAAAAFNTFLEKYPDDEMATSARFELEHLGKSPAELLPAPTGVAADEKKPN